MAERGESDMDPAIEQSVREALPTGHPLAWAILVHGTLLEGTPWPGWGAVQDVAVAGGKYA
jgi:hypothetical protein